MRLRHLRQPSAKGVLLNAANLLLLLYHQRLVEHASAISLPSNLQKQAEQEHQLELKYEQAWDADWRIHRMPALSIPEHLLAILLLLTMLSVEQLQLSDQEFREEPPILFHAYLNQFPMKAIKPVLNLPRTVQWQSKRW